MKRFFILLLSTVFIVSGFGATPDLSVLLKKYPDANMVLLDDQEYIKYNADGSSVSTDSFSYRVLTEKGRNDLRKLAFRFYTGYEKVAVTGLTINKPDGRIITLDPAKLGVVSIDASQMDARIYDPNSKQLSITIPDLEVGDKLNVTVKEECFKSRIPGQWSGFAVLQSNCPVENYTYTIDAPAARPLLSIAVKNEAEGTLKYSRSQKDGRIIYRWQAKNVPQLIPEPGMPPLYACAMRVLTSTAKDWSEIASWYADLCEPKLAAITPEMKIFVKKTVSGKKSDMEKIHALFQYVSQRIRYTGITDEETAPGYEPHDVSLTFERGHGVCRDKAALLASLLKIAGFEAYPVLFMSGYPKDQEVPNIYFNHAIVGVKGKNGEDILMDPTFETTTELLPAYQGNCSYLVAAKKPTTLKRSPVFPAENNLLAIDNQAEVKKNTLYGKVTLDFKGIHDQMYRATFSEWKPEEVRRYFAGALRDIIPGAELKKCTVTPVNVRNMAQPLQVTLEYSAPEIFSPNTVAPIALPEFASRFGTIRNLYNALKLEKRRFPLEALPRAVSEKFTLKLPPQLKVKSLPGNVDLSIPKVLRLSRELNQNGDTISGKNFFAIDTAELTPSDYLKAKSALAKFETASKVLPLAEFTQTPAKTDFTQADYPGADSLIISDIRSVKLHSANSWDEIRTVKRKIFTYGGAVQHSTVNIPYHPLMEDVEISGEFITPDGKKHTLSAKEINRLDAPWATAARRYPAGKILTAAFPGVEPGSVVTCTVKRKVKSEPFFYLEIPSRSTEPVLLRKITAQAAGEDIFSFQIPLEFTYSGNEKQLTASITDQPRIIAEPSTPEQIDCIPVMQLFSGSIPAFVSNLDNALHTKAAVTPEIKTLAEKLKTPAEIHKYVTRNIVEAGPALNEAPWSIFSTPEETLKSGVGNSADRAILYGALCKALNIKFDFIAVSALPEKSQPEHTFKNCNSFERIILYLPDQRLFLNDSSRYAEARRLYSWNSEVLNLSTGKFGLPPDYPQIPRHIQGFSAEITVNSDKSADVKITETPDGIYAAELRRKLETATPEELKQFFQAKSAAFAQSAVFKDFKKLNNNTAVSYTFTIQDFLQKNGIFHTIELPGFKQLSSKLTLSGEKRIFPWQRRLGEIIMLNYTITIPENLSFTAKNTVSFKSATNNVPAGTVLMTVSRQLRKNTRSFMFVLHLPFETVSPQEYPRLLKLNKLLNTPALRQVILEERKK
ncbi:MAG: DUF3857 domain-containing protein [Lentisphaerae bacterium]|nr:DUF3857 domain-containing protein [Lentisphaerota bacterium]